VEGIEVIDNSPMFYAIRLGDVKTIELFINNGADID